MDSFLGWRWCLWRRVWPLSPHGARNGDSISVCISTLLLICIKYVVYFIIVANVISSRQVWLKLPFATSCITLSWLEKDLNKMGLISVLAGNRPSKLFHLQSEPPRTSLWPFIIGACAIWQHKIWYPDGVDSRGFYFIIFRLKKILGKIEECHWKG